MRYIRTHENAKPPLQALYVEVIGIVGFAEQRAETQGRRNKGAKLANVREKAAARPNPFGSIVGNTYSRETPKEWSREKTFQVL